jgi:hypothetical protein
MLTRTCRVLSTFALAAATGLAALVTPDTAWAATTVRGTVTCLSGDAVQGVWVSANSGGSGWASWTPYAGDPSKATWSRSLPNGGDYYIAVGCGGSPSSWKRTLYSDTISEANTSLLCNDVQGQPRYGRCF